MSQALPIKFQEHLQVKFMRLYLKFAFLINIALFTTFFGFYYLPDNLIDFLISLIDFYSILAD